MPTSTSNQGVSTRYISILNGGGPRKSLPTFIFEKYVRDVMYPPLPLIPFVKPSMAPQSRVGNGERGGKRKRACKADEDANSVEANGESNNETASTVRRNKGLEIHSQPLSKRLCVEDGLNHTVVRKKKPNGPRRRAIKRITRQTAVVDPPTLMALPDAAVSSTSITIPPPTALPSAEDASSGFTLKPALVHSTITPSPERIITSSDAPPTSFPQINVASPTGIVAPCLHAQIPPPNPPPSSQVTTTIPQEKRALKRKSKTQNTPHPDITASPKRRRLRKAGVPQIAAGPRDSQLMATVSAAQHGPGNLSPNSPSHIPPRIPQHIPQHMADIPPPAPQAPRTLSKVTPTPPPRPSPAAASDMAIPPANRPTASKDLNITTVLPPSSLLPSSHPRKSTPPPRKSTPPPPSPSPAAPTPRLSHAALLTRPSSQMRLTDATTPILPLWQPPVVRRVFRDGAWRLPLPGPSPQDHMARAWMERERQQKAQKLGTREEREARRVRERHGGMLTRPAGEVRLGWIPDLGPPVRRR